MQKSKPFKKTYMHSVTKREERDSWNTHPLGSYEVNVPVGSLDYFKGLDEVGSDAYRFAFHMYGFDVCNGKRILDVGCGPGWNS